MSYLITNNRTDITSIDQSLVDAGGGFVVSSKTTLGSYLMDTNNISTQLSRQGTGTQVYSNGVSLMSVAAGQYVVCQSKQIHPYLTGKAQECEMTFDNFTIETNVVKKCGLFTSTRTAPYNTGYDGFYFESNGDTGVYNLVIANANTGLEVKVPSTNWDNPNITQLSTANFNIVKIDFLYLGGSQVRFWVYTDNGFELLHTYRHAGYISGTVVKSPNLPIRWEVRSSTGAGSMGQICAVVTTGGSVNRLGRQLSLPVSTLHVNANTAGTCYLLKAVRLSNTTGLHRTILDAITSAVSVTNDDIWVEVRLNPTIGVSIPALTWTVLTDENGVATGLEYANPDTTNSPSQNTVTGGTIVFGGFISSINRSFIGTSIDLVRKAGFDLNGVADIIALCATPLNTGTNADVHGNFTVLIN